MDRCVTMRRGHMKALGSSFGRLCVCVGLLFGVLFSLTASAAEGVAIAIVLDTSGSMKEVVRDSKGGRSPKYEIGNRALKSVVRKIEQFATNAPNRTVQAGLFTFSGDGAREVVKFGKFDANAMRDWIQKYPGPQSGTPLGRALESASEAVLKSDLPQKHVLVITDGENTVGPDPAQVLPRLIKQAERGGTILFTHFIAFDVAANVFAPLKKQGATVVAAADEKQLNQQLDFVLEEKILLEKDDKK
jgi:hypothetical protein